MIMMHNKINLSCSKKIANIQISLAGGYGHFQLHRSRAGALEEAESVNQRQL